MSVECNKIKGWTIRLQETNLSNQDFDFYYNFREKNQEYEFNGFNTEPNKVYLITDGMNGRYARLVYAERTGTGYDYNYDDEQYLELAKTDVPENVFNELNKAYEKLYGKKLDKELIQYAVWYHWW